MVYRSVIPPIKVATLLLVTFIGIPLRANVPGRVSDKGMEDIRSLIQWSFSVSPGQAHVKAQQIQRIAQSCRQAEELYRGVPRPISSVHPEEPAPKPGFFARFRRSKPRTPTFSAQVITPGDFSRNVQRRYAKPELLKAVRSHRDGLPALTWSLTQYLKIDRDGSTINLPSLHHPRRIDNIVVNYVDRIVEAVENDQFDICYQEIEAILPTQYGGRSI